MQTKIFMLNHEVSELPRGNKRRRIIQDQLRMWDTFKYTDDRCFGFTITKEVKQHTYKAFERFATYLMGELKESGAVTHWNRTNDVITFYACAVPEDNTVWCKPDNSWYMPQRHSIWK